MAVERALRPLRGPGYRPAAWEGWEIQLLKVRYPAATDQGLAAARGLSDGTVRLGTDTLYVGSRTYYKIENIRVKCHYLARSPRCAIQS